MTNFKIRFSGKTLTWLPHACTLCGEILPCCHQWSRQSWLMDNSDQHYNKKVAMKIFIRVNLTTIKDYITFHKKAGLTASHMAILRRENITYSAEICGQEVWISLMIKIAVNVSYWSSGWATSDDLPGSVLHIHAGGHLQTARCTHLRFAALLRNGTNIKNQPIYIKKKWKEKIKAFSIMWEGGG